MQKPSVDKQQGYAEDDRSPMAGDGRSAAVPPQEALRPSAAGTAAPNWLTEVQQLLVHFDAQESAMLALKSLLQDMGTVTGEGDDARGLRVRMEAATDLYRRLDADCRIVIRRLAECMSLPPDDFVVRDLIPTVAEHDVELAQSLRMARRRLLRVTWQVRRVSATTAWILAGYREIRHAVLQHTSGVADSDRYDASGRRSVTPESLRYGARS